MNKNKTVVSNQVSAFDFKELIRPNRESKKQLYEDIEVIPYLREPGRAFPKTEKCSGVEVFSGNLASYDNYSNYGNYSNYNNYGNY